MVDVSVIQVVLNRVFCGFLCGCFMPVNKELRNGDETNDEL